MSRPATASDPSQDVLAQGDHERGCAAWVEVVGREVLEQLAEGQAAGVVPVGARALGRPWLSPPGRHHAPRRIASRGDRAVAGFSRVPEEITMRLTRRAALLGLTSAVSLSAAALGRASLAVADAPTRQRLVVVLLRGAMDGMAAVVPYGDPHLAGWRRPLLPPEPGSASGQSAPGQSAPGRQDPLQDMGGFFGLHATMRQLGDMVPRRRNAGGPRGGRSGPQPQPFRGAGNRWNAGLPGGWTAGG